VRQLRLRDIGGIIVIDFIDMANPKNRALVQEALQTELERDRTKTYVVEISPLGLVEMTRQNVTDGPREILTAKCPTCGGDGIVVSAESAAIEIERRLRSLAAGSRAQAFRVEVNDDVAALLLGPAGERLAAVEEQARRRFLLQPRSGVPLDHFAVLAQGKRTELIPEAPFAEGEEISVRLREVARHDTSSGAGKVDGYEVSVAGAGKLIGKTVKARLDRIADGAAYATLVRPAPKPAPPPPVTAESQAEKPTRARRARPKKEPAAERGGEAVEVEVVADTEVETAATEEKPKKRTRRGSRGGRGRKKKPAVAATAGANGEPPEPVETAPKIHLPEPELGRDPEPAADGEEAPKPKKKTRRGSRGGRRRRKTPAVEAKGGDASP
jgi:ribonuclease G